MVQKAEEVKLLINDAKLRAEADEHLNRLKVLDKMYFSA